MTDRKIEELEKKVAALENEIAFLKSVIAKDRAIEHHYHKRVNVPDPYSHIWTIDTATPNLTKP